MVWLGAKLCRRRWATALQKPCLPKATDLSENADADVRMEEVQSLGAGTNYPMVGTTNCTTTPRPKSSREPKDEST
eukprot:4363119-Amphidinium_carterae.1